MEAERREGDGAVLEGDVLKRGLMYFSDERLEHFHLFRCCWKFLGRGEVVLAEGRAQEMWLQSSLGLGQRSCVLPSRGPRGPVGLGQRTCWQCRGSS